MNDSRNPPKRITDPTFVYRDSAHTNIAETFKRIRREQRKAREAEVARLTRQVVPIKGKA